MCIYVRCSDDKFPLISVTLLNEVLYIGTYSLYVSFYDRLRLYKVLLKMDTNNQGVEVSSSFEVERRLRFKMNRIPLGIKFLLWIQKDRDKL